MRQGLTDRTRDISIGDKLAEGERCNGSPHCNAKRRAMQFERKVEAAKPARKVSPHLSACFTKQRVARFALGKALVRHKVARDDRRSVAYDQQIATKRRRNAVGRRRASVEEATLPVPLRNTRNPRRVLTMTT